jgi:VanZ family protein
MEPLTVWKWKVIGFAIAATIVAAGCLMPNRWLPPLPNDKLLHFIAFARLMVLAEQIARNQMELVLWMLALFLAGWLLEGLQTWVPDRKFCWRDLAANTAGILAGAACSPAPLTTL